MATALLEAGEDHLDLHVYLLAERQSRGFPKSGALLTECGLSLPFLMVLHFSV